MRNNEWGEGEREERGRKEGGKEGGRRKEGREGGGGERGEKKKQGVGERESGLALHRNIASSFCISKYYKIQENDIFVSISRPHTPPFPSPVVK